MPCIVCIVSQHKQLCATDFMLCVLSPCCRMHKVCSKYFWRLISSCLKVLVVLLRIVSVRQENNQSIRDWICNVLLLIFTCNKTFKKCRQNGCCYSAYIFWISFGVLAKKQAYSRIVYLLFCTKAVHFKNVFGFAAVLWSGAPIPLFCGLSRDALLIS